MKKIKGYKVFNSDWTCRDKQYTCPGKFEENVNPAVCSAGMHFCRRAIDCFGYYAFDPNNKIAEVIAYGDVVENGDKCCTNKLKIVREIPWSELLDLVNMGRGNSGYNNSGSYNSGRHNSGSYNRGDGNSGSYNRGSYNSGDFNRGSYNSGSHNSGSCNSGDYNSGDFNTGDYNTGDYNSGYFNTTTDDKIRLFNKPSDWTHENWLYSAARLILTRMPEKNATDWWKELSAYDKATVKAIPNFDAEIFKEITGIDVNE